MPFTITKLAHTTLNVAKECHSKGFFPQAARLSNLAGELFLGLRDSKNDLL